MNETHRDLEAEIQRLDRALEHVLEPAMRHALVTEALLALSAADCCQLLAVVLERPPPTGSTFDLLRDTLHEVLRADADAATGSLPYERRRAIYEVATDLGESLVTKLLRTAPAQKEWMSSASRLPQELADVPLGTRRSLAKGEDVDLLDMLALDEDPLVLRNLLRNPHLTEREVLRIASLRPVPASTLEEVHRSDRWRNATGIRVALAKNPYCPVEIALQLASSLPLAELRDLSGDSKVHAHVREEANRELARRGP